LGDTTLGTWYVFWGAVKVKEVREKKEEKKEAAKHYRTIGCTLVLSHTLASGARVWLPQKVRGLDPDEAEVRGIRSIETAGDLSKLDPEGCLPGWVQPPFVTFPTTDLERTWTASGLAGLVPGSKNHDPHRVKSQAGRLWSLRLYNGSWAESAIAVEGEFGAEVIYIGLGSARANHPAVISLPG